MMWKSWDTLHLLLYLSILFDLCVNAKVLYLDPSMYSSLCWSHCLMTDSPRDSVQFIEWSPRSCTRALLVANFHGRITIWTQPSQVSILMFAFQSGLLACFCFCFFISCKRADSLSEVLFPQSFFIHFQ